MKRKACGYGQMRHHYEIDDTFIRWEKGTSDSFSVFVVTYTGINKDKLVGDEHCIGNDGVITHINCDLSYDMDCWVPIPYAIYRKITTLIDKAQLEALSILLRVRHEVPCHLKEGSCFVFFRRDGLLAVNQVQFFEAISDDTPGIHCVERLEEEGGEVHSKTMSIGNRTFHYGYSWILRNRIDEADDYIISKQAYNKIAGVLAKLNNNLRALLDVNPTQMKEDDGKWGYYDPERDWEIPCQWTDVSPFSEGLAAVANEKGKYGYINKYGKCVIPCEWHEVDWFHKGKAKVWDFHHNVFLIDTQGNIVASGEEAGNYDEGL